MDSFVLEELGTRVERAWRASEIWARNVGIPMLLNQGAVELEESVRMLSPEELEWGMIFTETIFFAVLDELGRQADGGSRPIRLKRSEKRLTRDRALHCAVLEIKERNEKLAELRAALEKERRDRRLDLSLAQKINGDLARTLGALVDSLRSVPPEHLPETARGILEEYS